MTVAVRILAYGLSADHCDEYLKIGKSIVIESLKHFCEAIIALYEGQYLRSPNEQDIACLLQEGEERGFVGSHNDVNVLDHSPLFDTLIHGRMPSVNYTVNGGQHASNYYLSDGIYPQWATLMQTIAHPTTGKERLFAKKQEVVRKDVERAFGVLQIWWGIMQGPVCYWKKDDLCNIMKMCIILDNMIIEDERGTDFERWRPHPDETISPPEYARNPAILVAHISSWLSRIYNRGTNTMLRFDLMEHLWNKFGDEAV
ncbi:hypothetical protein HHK36_024444 [Tetracentron sinense]|uniref:Uncharacterized protein n=1 Tax=Tetracentron sinense TaxID=13715 RepID=A0A834YN52_TETSI|nr:hypothetical protein HHK36_024444 [Tetracentron sinense]